MKNIFKTISFLLLLVLCFLGIAALKYNWSHNAMSENTGLGRLLGDEDRIDYLFIGSSHTRMSYDLKAFEQQTGSNSYLVAYNGMSYVLMYPMLEYLLESCDLDIRHIVVENYVSITSSPPALQDKNLFLASPPALKTEYIKLLRENEKDKSWKDYYELVILSKNTDIVTSPITNVFIDKVYYKGSYISTTTPCMPKSQFDKIESPVKSELQKLDTSQVEALKKIIKLLVKHDVDMTFIESPMPYRVENDANYSNLKQYLASLITKEGIRYIDGAKGFATDDNTNFVHVGHLSTKGRGIFTRQIADLLLNNNK